MSFALLLSLLLSHPAAAEQKAPLQYSAPRDAAKREPKSYEVSLWEPGTQVCMAVDEANLRAEPKEDAPVLATLPMGAKVTVKKRVGGVVKVSDRVDAWYQVKAPGAEGKPVTGFMFGNVMTQACYSLDMDGDGEEELVTVAMTADFKIRVRVMEPRLPPPHRVASAEVEPAGQLYTGHVGGPAEVSLVDAKRAGVPLIQVDSRPEQDSDYSTTYFSYVVPDGKPGVLGQVKVALYASGLADPPNISEYKVSFQAQERKATVLRTSTEEEDDGRDTKTVTRQHYQWQDGVYVELKQK